MREADEEAPMAETINALVLDLVEWIARAPRPYSEVIEIWRTSCPRLTIWEDAVEAGYVARQNRAGAGPLVTVTEDGERLLRAHGRMGHAP
jgi:hypothetical protein